MNLNVREIEERDIELLVNYWTSSTDEHLIGMGVDLTKLPSGERMTEMLRSQLNAPIAEKKSLALIWEVEGTQIGHTNVNHIEFGKQAKMHLHIWVPQKRRKGIGTQLVKMSVPIFFEKLDLKILLCEPYALNPAPNHTLKKVGFEFIKRYETIPGPINLCQDVNRWEMTRENLEALR